MVELYISPTEMQYGMMKGCVQGVNLTGISLGTNDCIVEVLLRYYERDIGYQKKLSSNNPYYLAIVNAGAAQGIVFQKVASGVNGQIIDGTGTIYNQIFLVDNIFRHVLHVFMLVRATSVIMMTNGHILRTTAKAAHLNIDTTRVWFFASPWVGLVTPSIGCMMRFYTGNLSGLTDAQLLAIHRKWLRTPFVTPTELAAYLRFKFTGRDAAGNQILVTSTDVYNEVNGETLAIQGGLNWGQIREPVWVPR